ncbi:beta-ketoacyl synthase [Cyanobium sp. Morenito 9A2]|uniref:beta-ketoacyl-[acyl-carrier-protein] synthase family protein n=1 Tax=Cyanobium sp. Morenito 9A2 TaxID=2823718 RepID=UPI0020CB7052|nr:beta-ketoacyl-[acyl-carrier-protein] synthase family protein [Cyanobium sp. Morenito 9A2]MCP9851223.1 beta-ketoacyl-[acyl-carrier-protein] synthase family protein [Cyanobium sp. Morenito 9A2]
MPQSSERIAVTGLGAVSPLGPDLVSTWRAILSCSSGIVALDPAWCADLGTRIGGRCNFDVTQVMESFEARRLDINSQMATLASLEAWDHAGRPDVSPDRTSVVFGCGMGGLGTLERQWNVLQTRGPERVHPLTVPMLMPNAPAAQVGFALGVTGGVHAPTAACASGAEAIVWGMDLLRLGRADAVLVGGVEAAVNRLALVAFGAMRALSQSNTNPEEASRPFDRGRDGFVLAEGAAALVLERESDSRARGHEPLGYLVGAGSSSDSHHVAVPEPEGRQAERAMAIAMADAGINPNQLAFINAHATGTALGDLAEARALGRLCSNLPDHHLPWVTAPKALLGHLLGAAGAMESVLTVLALRDGVVPPGRNCNDPDAALRLPLVLERPQPIEANLRHALNNCFGFGGHNVALVFEAPRCS